MTPYIAPIAPYRIVENPDTPSEELASLLPSESWVIRAKIVRHRNLSVDTLLILLGDDDPYVRQICMETHPYLPWAEAYNVLMGYLP